MTSVVVGLPVASTTTEEIDPLFNKAVFRYNELDKLLAESAGQSKLLKKEHQELGNYMIKYMQQNDLEKVNSSESNILLSTSKAQKPLSLPLISTVLNEMFAARPDITKKVIAGIEKARKENSTDRVRLKRVRHRA